MFHFRFPRKHFPRTTPTTLRRSEWERSTGVLPPVVLETRVVQVAFGCSHIVSKSPARANTAPVC
eukprot:140938-Rhodomonas_salina.3